MSEANKQTKHWYKKPWGILIIALLFVFFIFFSGFVFLVIEASKNDAPQKSPTTRSIPPETIKKIEGSNNYTLKGDDPKVTIVEFADFSCPLCKSSYTKLRSLKMKYKDDIEIIFRDYPVVSDQSFELALAAYCAGEQGLFWLMHDKLFEKQGINTKEEIFSLAEEAGVDGELFTTCFENEKYSDKIFSNYSDGNALEVSGTPTFFVNGEKISGDIPLENWYTIIDYILAN